MDTTVVEALRNDTGKAEKRLSELNLTDGQDRLKHHVSTCDPFKPCLK